MKKLFVFAVLAGWALSGLAQVPDSSYVPGRNVIKFLPANLPFQSVSFEYEGMVSQRSSIVLGVGIPNQEPILGKYGIDFDPELKCIKLGTTHIRTAIRHYYTGKKMVPRGLYIEPYLKYQHLKGCAYIEGIQDQTKKPYEGLLDFNFDTFNLGFQLGAQFRLAKIITLDFYLLGLEAGLLNGNMNSVSPSSTQATAIKAKIDNAKNDLPSFVGDKITVTQQGYRIKAKADNVIYPWYRGGISVGITF